jgi:HIV Tat-specific factor 1
METTILSSREAAASGFPTNPEEFDADERISFSKLDGKFLLVQDDGAEFEFDEALRRWVPVLDEALLEEQQRAYRVSGVDEHEPVVAARRKRKKEYVNGEDEVSWTGAALSFPFLSFPSLSCPASWLFPIAFAGISKFRVPGKGY